MAKTIRPLMDRILVKRTEVSNKSEGGIWYPENALEKASEGIVVTVGEGKTIDKPDGTGSFVRPLSVKPGDKVLWTKFSGIEVKLQGGDHLILREEDLLGIIE